MDSAKGATSSTIRPTSSVLTNNARDAVARSPLELFQWLVGIHTPLCLKDPLESATQSDNIGFNQRSKDYEHERWIVHLLPCIKRSPKPITRGYNVGLYQRSKDQERRARIAYLLTSYISNTLFLLQIMLAAAFTGLSAYKEANAVTLTILGAVNTVVAGCLAWQKGQGVPQRYRKAQDQYQALILEIEMTERSFIDLETGRSTSDAKLYPRVENARLQKLYETARADQQANYPDLYFSSKDMAKQVDDAKAETAKVQGDLTAKIEALMHKLEAKVGERVESAVDDISKK